MEAFGVIRRVKKSEATDGTHVRMKVIASEKGYLVCWRLVSMEVNQYERHDVIAGTPPLTVFRMLIAKAASHRHSEQGTEAKIVKRILSWSPAGFTWKANPEHALDLITWAGLEQSKAAAPTPGAAATTKTMRVARLKAVSPSIMLEEELPCDLSRAR